MFKKKLLVFLLFCLTLVPALAEAVSEKQTIRFFYSKSCPHCAEEMSFLKRLEKDNPEVEITYCPISQTECRESLLSNYEEYEVPEDKQGLVPIVFVKDQYFVGFDGEEGIGEEIKQSLQDGEKTKKKGVELPFIGEINPESYSLPALTVLMGILDGFNVCSLGALVLILGLVIGLRSRKKVFIYGGVFVLTTAVVYGLLIIFWYKLFVALSKYLRAMEVLIAALSLGGAAYFIKEFVRMEKYGVTCDSGAGGGIEDNFAQKIKKRLASPDKIRPLALAGSLLLFAAVITIVEFPCSAAVPVVYAGILSKANLPAFSYLIYISVFVLFYLLDELIVFAIASTKLTVWMSSPQFVKWITLIEAIILASLGTYYLVGF